MLRRWYSSKTTTALEKAVSAVVASSQSNSIQTLFKTNDYIVIDDFFDRDDAIELQRDIIDTIPDMSLNQTFVYSKASPRPRMFPKEHILEYDYKGRTIETKKNPTVLDSLVKDSSLVTMFNILCPQLFGGPNLLVGHDLKIQYNRGHGGCFPIHFDSDPSVDSRVVTCILYLSLPERTQEHGGQLVFYPHTMTGEDRSPIVIEPTFNRLVVFGSQTMAHRVLPNFADRYCCTFWLQTQRPVQPMRQDGKDDAKALMKRFIESDDPSERMRVYERLCCIPEIRRHVIKYLWRDAWKASLEESHAPSPLRDELIASFETEMATVSRILSPILDSVARHGDIQSIG
ncbi:hypothetical protein M9434_007037 [Picochlorum sp. BPE23]|nr:hypothetical protein M9434_007037 [Picochlorum sp. BPE23]